jgi:hypothetical protein
MSQLFLLFIAIISFRVELRRESSNFEAQNHETHQWLPINGSWKVNLDRWFPGMDREASTLHWYERGIRQLVESLPQIGLVFTRIRSNAKEWKRYCAIHYSGLVLGTSQLHHQFMPSQGIPGKFTIRLNSRSPILMNLSSHEAGNIWNRDPMARGRKRR